MKLTVTDIFFLALMLFALGLLIWRLFGFPDFENIIAVLISGVLALFTHSFINFGKINSRLSRIEFKLELIWNEFKKRKKI